jgi:antitoxin HicB
MQYAVTLTPDTNGTYLIKCRDFPELTSCGTSVEDCCKEGLDALETCFMMYIDCRRPIPAPTLAQDGEQRISVPLKVAMKVALYNEMLAKG